MHVCHGYNYNFIDTCNNISIKTIFLALVTWLFCVIMNDTTYLHDNYSRACIIITVATAGATGTQSISKKSACSSPQTGE